MRRTYVRRKRPQAIPLAMTIKNYQQRPLAAKEFRYKDKNGCPNHVSILYDVNLKFFCSVFIKFINPELSISFIDLFLESPLNAQAYEIISLCG